MSGSSSRQNQMVADEMFPDGPGGALDFVDVEDGVSPWNKMFVNRTSKSSIMLSFSCEQVKGTGHWKKIIW